MNPVSQEGSSKIPWASHHKKPGMQRLWPAALSSTTDHVVEAPVHIQMSLEGTALSSGRKGQ